MIVTLELQPGENLIEKDLSDHFSVSRTPVREAILRLFDQRLVQVVPQHGTFVAEVDPQTVHQAHFLRTNLEIPMIRALCTREDVDLAPLRALLTEQRMLLVGGSLADFRELDDAFHQALFAAAGLGEIWTVIEGRKAHLDRLWFLEAPRDGHLSHLVGQHAELVDAVSRRDADEAAVILSDHIDDAIRHLEVLVAERPDLFDGRAPAARRRGDTH